MKPEVKKSLESYDREAERLAALYDSLSAEDILPALEGYIEPLLKKKTKCKALDLGCGTGRDAIWLAQEKGFAVTAVDGSKAMLAQAKKRNSHPAVTYIADILPDIAAVRNATQRNSGRYDLVLVNAVWMHLDEADRRTLFGHIAALVNKGGVIYITIRQGPSPEGRPMFAVPEGELEALAEEHGMMCLQKGCLDDKAGRSGLRWRYEVIGAASE